MEEVVQHTWQDWADGLFWSFIGILVVKFLMLVLKGITWQMFKFKHWFNENTFDVILGLIISACLLRGGDVLIHWIADKFNWTLPHTTDFTILLMVLSGLIQWGLHKIGRKAINKRLEEERHVHNDTCGHKIN